MRYAAKGGSLLVPWLRRSLAACCLAVVCASALARAQQPKRVLFLAHSAGFAHSSVPVAKDVVRTLDPARITVDVTDDVTALTRSNLARYDAVLFFTSGELPLDADGKQALVEFIANGKGFAGVHSATDTFYQWPEYGEIIGARFDGHPWVQTVRVDVEDPEHSAVAHLTPSFEITEEIYQFRSFTRESSRVLLTLDMRSVDRNAQGVNRTDEDFALAWTRYYNKGRVFYTALGHFDATWRDARFQKLVLGGLLWVTGQSNSAGEPRPAVRPELSAAGVGNSASYAPPGTVAAGTAVSLFGRNLTSGAALAGAAPDLPHRLAGTRALYNGATLPIYYASPRQVNVVLPNDAASSGTGRIDVCSGPTNNCTPVTVQLSPAVPGVFAAVRRGSIVTIWATGLGAVEPSGTFFVTKGTAALRVAGRDARILYSGLAPGWPGLYQVNAELPPGTDAAADAEFRFNGAAQTVKLVTE